MFEFTDDPVCADEGTAACLRALGEALLFGKPWGAVLADQRWAQRRLYIVYTHDRLGTPDKVEGICFDLREAEALANGAIRRQRSAHPLQQHFYQCKLIESRLGILAVHERADSFQRHVIRHLTSCIKAALCENQTLPADVTPVTIGHDETAWPAFVDVSGTRIVLWEDCCDLINPHESIDFYTRSRPARCGLMNGLGEIIVPAAFQQIAPLQDGLAVAKRNGRFGYIDGNGCVVVPFVHEAAAACCQGLLLVKRGGLWGALDCDGKQVIAPRYESLEHDIGNEALRATLDDRHGYLSLKGELLAGFCAGPLLLAKHSFASERAVFIARSQDGDMSWLVDAQGWPAGGRHYTSIRYGRPEENLLCARMEGSERYGYIDLRGEPMIPFQFSDACNFSEGLAAAAVNDPPTQYGYIDRHGNWMIAPQFTLAGEFHQGLAPAAASATEKPAQWYSFSWRSSTTVPEQRIGYIDRNGNWAIAPQFLDARPFCEGMAAVRLESGWGYIDINGGIGIPGLYHEAGAFRQGVARVARRYDGPLRWGLIDACGREIIPLRFDRLSYPKRGLMTARDEYGLWGCFTLFGNIVLPFVYRDMRDLERALAMHCALPS